jgi:tetratricopeptide (TPR) repeat protein
VQQAVADALPDSNDAGWVESHVLALLGQASETELGGDQRGVAFAGWRRFVEALAEQRPLVLVFEDLHWADESMLDFVDELVDWITDVPLLVVGTARPELLDRRPGWGGGKLNATTLALAPLSNDETALLISQLLARPVLAAESQLTLLERAGGNPLYAEQFAELYLERGSAEELPLPETLQGIIAARLDGLSSDEKELIRDAAVVGKVFWTGALGRRQDAGTTLHTLERKGFVRRQKRSSVEDESEFAFAHALVRDVAYGQIPRAERAAKHRRVAEWIESLGRPEDHAEMLAYHWSSALELARAAGDDDVAIAERARRALSEAGDRAFALNAFLPAARYFSDALSLSAANGPEYAALLFRRARSLHLAAAEGREQALVGARDALLEIGDRGTAAEAEAFLSQAAWYRGSRDESNRHMTQALDLVAESEPSTAKARVLAMSARLRMLADENDDAIRIANEALALAESLELDELRAHALTTRGATTNKVDSSAGREDVEEALRIALDANSPIAALVANNLAVLATWRGDIPGAGELYVEAGELARRFGHEDALRFTRGNVIWSNFFLGNWDSALESANEFIAECETSSHYMEGGVREVRSYIRFARGDAVGAFEDARISLAQGREIRDPQRLLPSLLNSARVHALAGQRDEALEYAREAIDVARTHVAMAGALGLLSMVVEQLGVRDEILEILDRAPPGPWVDVVRAGASGNFVRASEIFAGFRTPTLLAEMHLLAGETLIQSGRRDEGIRLLEDALAFYRSVGATFFVRRAEVLLPASA